MKGKNIFCLFFTAVIIISHSTCFAQNLLPQNTYKYKVSKQVIENIALAYGAPQSPPALEIYALRSIPNKNILMYYPGEQPKIVMDEEVYDLCTSFGKDSVNALAALIGHELAHHYEKHNWCSSFAFLFGEESQLARNIKKSDKQQKLNLESEADYYGGFYGYVAGYSTYNITSKLLDAIYAKYKLPEEVPGYPSKTERKNIAAKRMEELSQWSAIFDAGEFLFALKEYEKAATCFQYLSEKFPSREIFNNTGVCKLLSALEYYDTKEIPFILPIEFDAKTRLKTGIIRGDGMDPREKEKIKIQLLEDAIKEFDKSIQRDPAYFTAKINKGCANILMKNYAMAEGISNEVIKNKQNGAQKNELAKAYSLKAVASWASGKNDEALKYFELGNQLFSNSTSKYNLNAITELNKDSWDLFVDYIGSYYSENESSPAGVEKSINPAIEKIGDTNAKDVLFGNNSKPIEIFSNPPAALKLITENNYGAIVISQKSEQMKFLYTKTGYGGKTSQGVSIGSTADFVKQKYGEPTYTLSSVKGEYYAYKKSRIVFLLNSSGSVEKWFLFNRN